MFPRKYNAVLRDVAAKIRPITLMNITENPVESIHSDDASNGSAKDKDQPDGGHSPQTFAR